MNFLPSNRIYASAKINIAMLFQLFCAFPSASSVRRMIAMLCINILTEWFFIIVSRKKSVHPVSMRSYAPDFQTRIAMKWNIYFKNIQSILPRFIRITDPFYFTWLCWTIVMIFEKFKFHHDMIFCHTHKYLERMIACQFRVMSNMHNQPIYSACLYVFFMEKVSDYMFYHIFLENL